MKISNANISFNHNGTPVANAFDDVYFSNESGILETQYVFIESNHLKERWKTFHEATFCIGETGFGTGLNFLVAAKEFINFKHNNPTSALERLFFFTTEKFPLTKDDLIKALALWPELSDLSNELIMRYPMPLPGLHRIHLFNKLVTLDLWLGDATEGFANAHAHRDGRIDAWFLDGFAPSKNDTMWQPSLFEQIKRLSRDGATFATFTAAGAVKRGLKEVGFAVKKQKGFGKKREMLIGTIPIDAQWQQQTRQAPIFHRQSAIETVKHVAVVGGGIAAAICALKLVQAGKKVSLYCADNTLAQGASGNELGGFYPQLNAEAGVASQIHAHSFLYATHFYKQLLADGFEFSHDWCGVLQLCFNDNVETRYQNMIKNQTWPAALVNWIESAQASEIANIDIPCASLLLPLGGWISPPALIKACIKAAQQGDFTLHLNHRFLDSQYKPADHVTVSRFKVSNENSADSVLELRSDCLVLACGAESHLLKALDLPFRMTRGQVERIPTTPKMGALLTVLCHKGYMTPAVNDYHAMGSTYIKNDANTQYRAEEAALNLAMHQKALHSASWVDDISLNTGDAPGRAAIRCSLPDHLPAVGAVHLLDKQKLELGELYKAKPDNYYPIPSSQPNVFLLTGLGSRGLTTAPLMAELLVSQICSSPLPLDNRLLNALNPNRFLIRDLIRRREVKLDT